MAPLISEFNVLEPEYQRLLLLTQETHGIEITPLQLLGGGRSGAILYLVSVRSAQDPQTARHLVLKLDRITPWNNGERSEVARHKRALSSSPEAFSEAHLSKLVFDPVQSENTISFFYSVAGDSLQKFRPLSAYSQQKQIQQIFAAVTTDLLSAWQSQTTFQKLHPQSMIQHWLGHRLDSERGHIKEFLETTCQIDPTIQGFIINDSTFPNPFLYSKEMTQWGNVRDLEGIKGFIHGDLNTNNVLADFSMISEQLEGYFLIDFAEFESDGFLFYDHAYLELSYLIQQLSRVPFQSWQDLVLLLAHKDLPKAEEAPIDLAGTTTLLRRGREAIYKWVLHSHSTLTDDLWGQFFLSATAAGLSFSNKLGLRSEERLAGLLYSAAHLKRFLQYFELAMPGQAVVVSIAPDHLSKGVKDVWESLFTACHHFDEQGRLFVLVIGPNRDSDSGLYSSIGRIGWQLVLDFDPETQEGGLYHCASDELKQRRSLHIVTSEDDVDVSLRKTSYWYAARGLVGRSGTLPDSDDWLKWSRMYYQHLQSFLLKIASLEELPVTVVVAWDNPEYVSKICEFLYQAFGDRAEFIFATENQQSLDSLRRVYQAQSFALSLKQFAIGIRSLITSPAVSSDYVLLPAQDNSFAALTPEDVNWIEEEFSVVHIGVGTQEDKDREIGREFLRGSKISWFELSLHYDVARDKTGLVKDRVLMDLRKRLVSRINIYHFPGSGGTTVGLRIAWEVHKEYPTLILNAVSSQTLERFRKVYSYTNKSILVVVEAAQVESDTLDILYNQVESEHLPIVFLRIARRFGELGKDSDRSFYIKERLDEGEANRFAQIYGEAEPTRSAALQLLARDQSKARLRIPFFFGLIAFGEEFILLQPYVSSRIQKMSEVERRIMCYLSMCYRYAQTALPAQIFSHITGLRGTVQLDKILKPERLSLLVREDNRDWRPVHFLVGNEIAEQIIAADNLRQNWFQNLSAWAMQLIEDFAKSDATAFTTGLLTRLFVSRDSEDIFIEIEEKPKFSRLIQNIRSAEGQLAVLQKLVDMFPTEPHFIAHLARFRSSQQEHPRAVEDATKAVSLMPKDDVLRHIKGSVIKNWVGSMIRGFDTNLRRKTEIPPENLQRMVDLAALAEEEFTTARRLAPENEYPYVSHVQLLTKLVEFGFRKSGKQNMQVFLADGSANEYRDMVERAETILDQAIRLRAGRDLSDHIRSCENEIDLFYGNYSQVLSSWNQMLERGDVYRPPVRRSLVRAYLSRQKRSWDLLSLKDLKRIYDLMEQNLLEEPQDERNVRLWFNAARRVTSVSIDVAIERLTYLYATNKPLDAIYYLYVMHALKALEGSDLAKKNTDIYLKQCQSIARHKPHGGFAFDWLGNGEELTRLVHFKRLGDFKEDTGFYENALLLKRVRGKIIQASKPESGYIELKSGLRAFFVPQRRHKGATLFGSQDVNKDVDFYLGFSYEGLRAWSVSFIK